MRFLVLIIVAVLCLGFSGDRWPSGGGGSGVGVPGLAGSVGNADTLQYIYDLKQAQAPKGQFNTIYFDPIYGDDTNPGTYDEPMMSIWALKNFCLRLSRGKCVIKESVPGKQTWFSQNRLVVTYGTSERGLRKGDIMAFSSPTGTAEVLEVYPGTTAGEEIVATTWLSGDEPTNASTFTVATSIVTGNVDEVKDTFHMKGWRVSYFPGSDVNTTTEAITLAGHDYADGDGPFRIGNSGTFGTFSANAPTNWGTDVYICNSVANTSIEICLDAAGTQPSNWTDASPTGEILYGLLPSVVGSGDDYWSVGRGFDFDNCNPETEDTICGWVTAENPDNPWGVDGGRMLYGMRTDVMAGNTDGAFGWGGVNCRDKYDTGGPPQTSGSPDGSCDFDGTTNKGYYMTSSAHLFHYDPTSTEPANNGWFLIENGVIQNFAGDVVSGSDGAKIVAIDVKGKKIRNGKSDRGTLTSTVTADYAHNSVLSTTGANSVDAERYGAHVIWIGGEGSTSDSGSNDSSGGFVNCTGTAVCHIFANGDFSKDAISGDTCVGRNAAGGSIVTRGGPCAGFMIVSPGADTLFVGPRFVMGNTAAAQNLNLYPEGENLLSMTGAGRVRFINTVWDHYSEDTSTNYYQRNKIVAMAGPGSNDTYSSFQTISGYNNTIIQRFNNMPFEMCAITGASAATATSTRTIELYNTLFDNYPSSHDAMILFGTCGAAGYSVIDAVSRMVFKMEGIIDRGDRTDTFWCNDGPYMAETGGALNAGTAGSCFTDDAASSTGNSYATLIEGQADTAGYTMPAGSISFFDDATYSSDVSGDQVDWDYSSGDVAVAGLLPDLNYRCREGSECEGTGTAALYDVTINLSSVWKNPTDSCWPAFILGEEICEISYTPVRHGAR